MHGKYGLKNNELLLGLILVLVGISLLTDELLFFNLIWQILLVVWGILLLKEKNLVQGISVVAVAIVFLLDTVFNLDITYKLIGISSIGLGVKILFSNMG